MHRKIKSGISDLNSGTEYRFCECNIVSKRRKTIGIAMAMEMRLWRWK